MEKAQKEQFIQIIDEYMQTHQAPLYINPDREFDLRERMVRVED
jgi:hypothetical protein